MKSDYILSCRLQYSIFLAVINQITQSDWFVSFQIPYTADQTQLAFLQMLSKQASQRLTYHCRNSRATDRGLELVGVNEYEFQTTGEGMETLSHTVTRDECKVGDLQRVTL